MVTYIYSLYFSYRILNSLQYFSESLDIRNFTSANVVFSLHTYALQLQDILTSQFRGEVFTVDLGSVSEAMNIEGNIPRNKIATSELTTNISRNLTTAAKIPRSFVDEVKECQNTPPSTTQRLSHFLFLTDVLFQSEVDNSSILASVILSSRLSCADNRSLSVPVKIFYRINEMVSNLDIHEKKVGNNIEQLHKMFKLSFTNIKILFTVYNNYE